MIISEKPLNEEYYIHKIQTDPINKKISEHDQIRIHTGKLKIIDKIIDHQVEENQDLTDFDDPNNDKIKIYYKIRFKSFYGENDEWMERNNLYQKFENANEYESIYISNLQYIDEDKKRI